MRPIANPFHTLFEPASRVVCCSAMSLRFKGLDRAIVLRSNSAFTIVRRTPMVRSIVLASVIATLAIGSAFAQESCESKAVGKDGKALAGAAKTSFMKKCMADQCATKAVSSDGKPLAGAAKTSFMKKCEKGA
jgi:hypothetical protein